MICEVKKQASVPSAAETWDQTVTSPHPESNPPPGRYREGSAEHRQDQGLVLWVYYTTPTLSLYLSWTFLITVHCLLSMSTACARCIPGEQETLCYYFHEPIQTYPRRIAIVLHQPPSLGQPPVPTSDVPQPNCLNP